MTRDELQSWVVWQRTGTLPVHPICQCMIFAEKFVRGVVWSLDVAQVNDDVCD